MSFCTECGKENVAHANFCNACGQSLGISAEPYRQAQTGGSVFAILGWVFTAISILFFPILFGAGGVIFGYLHKKVNKTHGTIIMIAAIACGLFGTLLGAALAGY